MNTSIQLCTADKLRIESLLDHHDHGLRLTPDQKVVLQNLLKKAKIVSDETMLESHVGFYDQVTLISPEDSTDSFNLEISMPSEADLDADRISVALPISAAVLGRHTGSVVSWETPVGERNMKILSINKCAQPQLV